MVLELLLEFLHQMVASTGLVALVQLFFVKPLLRISPHRPAACSSCSLSSLLLCLISPEIFSLSFVSQVLSWPLAVFWLACRTFLVFSRLFLPYLCLAHVSKPSALVQLTQESLVWLQLFPSDPIERNVSDRGHVRTEKFPATFRQMI